MVVINLRHKGVTTHVDKIIQQCSYARILYRLRKDDGLSSHVGLPCFIINPAFVDRLKSRELLQIPGRTANDLFSPSVRF